MSSLVLSAKVRSLTSDIDCVKPRAFIPDNLSPGSTVINIDFENNDNINDEIELELITTFILMNVK